MMTIKEKIAALRQIMERENLDAYIISGTDPHNSEYLPAPWQQRKWISGFTGSFGTVVVTKNKAGLWTDTRYFIQAAQELDGTDIEMHKLRIPGAIDYPEWLHENLDEKARVGIDGFCMTVSSVKHLQEKVAPKEIKIIEKTDLLGEIWLDRPALPETPIFSLDTKYTGISAKDKINDIRQILRQQQADYILFSCLDEIAWLYNIRCNDIAYNPVAISYAIVGKEKAYLFVKPSKVPVETARILSANGIEIQDYHHLLLFLEELSKNNSFCLDQNTLNFAIYSKIAAKFPFFLQVSPIILKKAIKNDTEIEGFRTACLKDGVAMTQYLYWLEHEVPQNTLSETAAAEKLTSLRMQNSESMGDSFHTISAYGKNAALPHYSAIPGNDSVLKPESFYLVDSGGQYKHGTTDITRTIPLGKLTQLEKEDYTLVLKGMIALSRCIFPKGSTGANIDIVARQPLWNYKRNYGHGTGHGIGHFLCVHEGPQDIRQAWKNQELLPGMITSNEPGMYREGLHGIRHENIIACVPVANNEFGEWLGFETLTLCYFDTSAILPELLISEEKEWLNNYHRVVYEKLSPLLPTAEAAWLKNKTKEI